MIKDMQKRMRDRLRVEKENKDLVAQGDLIRETHRSVPMLKVCDDHTHAHKRFLCIVLCLR